MNLFQFREGSSELLPFYDRLWGSFIQTQTANAGDVAEGIAAYLKSKQENK